MFLDLKAVKKLETKLAQVCSGKGELTTAEAHNTYLLVKESLRRALQPLKIGDKVVGTFGRHLLYCGSGFYPYAIVVSLDPFVMISEKGDMLWTQQDPEDFEPIGKVSKVKVKRLKWKRRNG